MSRRTKSETCHAVRPFSQPTVACPYVPLAKNESQLNTLEPTYTSEISYAFGSLARLPRTAGIYDPSLTGTVISDQSVPAWIAKDEIDNMNAKMEGDCRLVWSLYNTASALGITFGVSERCC